VPARRAPGGRSGARKGAGAEAGGSGLAPYERKRDFASTPEPAPAEPADGAGATSLRFVIHEHSASRLHWDLRLERDGVLASWAVPKGMPEAPGENRFAAATEDHPLEYLDFHGEIPAGNYGAGTMTIWDRGTYEPLKWEPRKVEVRLHGERLDARYALFPIDKEEPPKDWMIHRMDPPADPAREPMPARIVPMLARPGELPDEDGSWAYEIKWDGVRAIAYSTPGELRLESRNLNDITASYPELTRLGRALGSHQAVLDGEIVAFDPEGRPSFGALQQRMHVSSREAAKRLAARTPVTYVLFDLLWLDGHSLMGRPYSERRERLLELGLDADRWQTPQHVVGHGEELLRVSAEQRLEGIVAKRLASTYEPGRRPTSWVKVKSMGRQEFVVGGWMPGRGRRRETIGALLLGVYEPGGVLRYAGRVGTGFSDAELRRLQQLLAPLATEESPFGAGERPPREAQFCRPELVAEVEFAEWTDAGIVRHPSYKGLREDKAAAEVVREDVRLGRVGGAKATPAGRKDARVGARATPARREDGHGGRAGGANGTPARAARRKTPAGGTSIEVDGRELSLSNLDKVLYPQTGFTKGELIDYYAALAPVLLPHLQQRPLTVTRWPDGVEAKSFFQKQSPAHRPDWVQTARVASASKPIDYTLCEDEATLLWLANLAAIELHTPLARADAMERPTAVVFDLDPGAPAGMLECCQVAQRLHGVFAGLGLQSFAKTSGSKGLQVYIPLNSDETAYAQTKPFAKAVAELLEKDDAELVVSRMTKTQRTGKVLIDWSQNDARKTTVCVYSLRALARPTASTPLAWEEIDGALDGGDASELSFDAPAVLERVAAQGDLMAPVLSLVQELPAL
jgi:bifunctional non-homologous end joining protein LigD